MATKQTAILNANVTVYINQGKYFISPTLFSNYICDTNFFNLINYEMVIITKASLC